MAQENDAALATLEEQRTEYEGRLRLARRAEEDVTRRIDEKRLELHRAEAEAAVEAYERSLAERNSAAERFASAAEAAVAALREYEAAHRSVASALNAARSRPAGRASVKTEDEPPVVAEALDTLVDVVRERLDSDLERDLVETAARSPMGHNITKLPVHLQALARERRGAILKEATGRPQRERHEEPEG